MKSDNKLPAQPASPCSKETDDAKAPSPDSLRPPRPELRSRIMTDIDGILKQPHVRNWNPFTQHLIMAVAAGVLLFIFAAGWSLLREPIATHVRSKTGTPVAFLLPRRTLKQLGL